MTTQGYQCPVHPGVFGFVARQCGRLLPDGSRCQEMTVLAQQSVEDEEDEDEEE
jgi:hypothetical protein